MKKTITIPMGKITGGLIAGAGVCTSVVVDNVLKKDIDENSTKAEKVVNDIGRTGMTLLISSAFTALATAAYCDKSMDIKIPVKVKSKGAKLDKVDSKDSKHEKCCTCQKKKHKSYLADEDNTLVPVREKDRKRFSKALKLWESILHSSMEMDRWCKENIDGYDQDDIVNESLIPEDIRVDVKEVSKFNSKMEKLSNLAGLEFAPIIESSDSTLMMSDIIESTGFITELLSAINAIINPEIINEYPSTDEEDIDIAGDIDSNVIDLYPEKVVDEKEIIFSELQRIFAKNDLNLPENFLSDLINRIDDNVGEIVQKFISGEISAADACDRIIAHITEADEPTETE